eukprot:gnl/MRDRNA2_/MRDRNA2_102897_c0_seq1.p1 gnl/MRDRNA2_/MRDRNA2_102897_c0~~gnl/MRDRNA2_/MRDRNA2_102897_c0_seq1.p1  ORF type:complete len:1184 (+),score=191.76 gnl/MRDRNA2_/MRDRNA2_102897_c0_seq1:98-3649(+)
MEAQVLKEYLEESPERQGLIVQLASLLEIGFALAQDALQQSRWNLEAAVDIAYQLSSNSSSSSSGSQSSSSSSNNVSTPPHGDAISNAGGFGQSSNSQSSSASGNPMNQVPIASSTSSTPSASELVSNPCGYKRTQSFLAHDVPDIYISVNGPSAKKQRLEQGSSEAVFKIPNNNSDPPAANPPLFLAHPLREEQRRSLGWMISQEAKIQQPVNDEAHETNVPLIGGGLLADRMGYGKTSTAIGLISLDVGQQLRQPGQEDVPFLKEPGHIPSDSTLIVCPSHLVDQWEGEFWKFLGSKGVQISKPMNSAVMINNAQTVTRTFNGQQAKTWCNRFRNQMGITVSKCPVDGPWALITHITPERQHQIEQVFGSRDAIRCGDMIGAIHCTNLIDDQGTVESFSSASFTGISEFFRSGHMYCTRRVQAGFIRDANGREKPYYGSRKYTLHYTEKSTLKITMKRLDAEAQRTQVVRGNGPLKVLTLRDVSTLTLLQQRDFVSTFHVVLVSASIHSSTKYGDFIKEASEVSGLMEKKVLKLRAKVRQWCQNRSTFETRALRKWPALFEVIFWRRVIFDEFHESEAWEYRVREMLRSLGATHKWGLSGTPPLGSPAAVAEVAGLLSSASPSAEGNILAKALYWGSNLRASTAGASDFFASCKSQLEAVAENFVKGYIRQNTSDLIEQIGIVEHDELVEHTSEERLIYRQACHDQGIFNLADGYNHMSLASRAVLLKRCSHFDMEDADSATSAVNRLGNNKREWLDKLEKQLWLEVARAMQFKLWNSKVQEAIRSTNVQHPDAKAVKECVLSSAVEDVKSHLPDITLGLEQSLRVAVKMHAQDGSLRLRPEVRLVQPIQENEYYKEDRHRHLIVHEVARRVRDREANDVLSNLGICEQACNGHLDIALCSGLSELVTLLDKAYRSLQFYNQQLSTLTKQEADHANECSICLESTSDIQTMAIIPCSHVFHAECIREVLASNPYCPECRAPVNMSHVSSVVMELKPPEPQIDGIPGPSRIISVAWKKNGSKLNAVAKRLRDIRRQDPKAKALVFVQWADLEAKVCCALKDHGVPFMCLSRESNSHSRLDSTDGAVLRSFQEDKKADGPYVLVLSLQRAAAGTNLTSASHVLFVHPMNAETVHTAAAYERQALARVRRIGQTRKEVHLWRFVTKQTVEEHIWKLHRNDPVEA